MAWTEKSALKYESQILDLVEELNQIVHPGTVFDRSSEIKEWIRTSVRELSHWLDLEGRAPQRKEVIDEAVKARANAQDLLEFLFEPKMIGRDLLQRYLVGYPQDGDLNTELVYSDDSAPTSKRGTVRPMEFAIEDKPQDPGIEGPGAFAVSVFEGNLAAHLSLLTEALDGVLRDLNQGRGNLLTQIYGTNWMRIAHECFKLFEISGWNSAPSKDRYLVRMMRLLFILVNRPTTWQMRESKEEESYSLPIEDAVACEAMLKIARTTLKRYILFRVELTKVETDFRDEVLSTGIFSEEAKQDGEEFGPSVDLSFSRAERTAAERASDRMDRILGLHRFRDPGR